mmetsp:Transcript_46581/g.120582  ORF Transcript_46581/g.120582 Transcript_46581/m.120582 type:complete len:200 (-) Transcript_46581:1392-1991(-)
MCSASSTLPRPVVPSSTTMPPSAKGLPAGAFVRGADSVGMVCSGLWIALLKVPPSMSMTLTMPGHRLRLHRSRTPCLVIVAFEKAFGAVGSAPGSRCSVGESSLRSLDQGKRSFRSRVRPGHSTCSFNVGWKVLIGCALPLTLIAGRALKTISPVARLLVSSSQRTPSGGALAINRADKFTQSPRTVYSMRLALPQTPQ